MFYKEYPSIEIRLNKSFVKPIDMGFYKISRHPPAEVLDVEFLEDLKLKDIDVREVQIFIAPPYYKGKIHIDGHSPSTSIGALNYVITEGHWNMEWFETTRQNLDKKTTAGKTAFISYEDNDCVKLKEAVFFNPTLIQAGIPHRVNNFSNTTRICISIRFIKNNFDYLMNQFNEYSTKV